MTASTERLAAELASLSKQRATGVLAIDNEVVSGKMHMVGGRLLYATGGSHRVRRWDRALKQYAPNWRASPSDELPEPWEPRILYQGISEKQLSVSQAKKVIKSVTLEVFFGLAGQNDLSYRYRDGQVASTQPWGSLALSYQEVEPAIAFAAKMQQQWLAGGLGKLSPTLVPTLKQQVSPEAFSGMAKYLNGQFTLWDIAARLRKPVIVVTRALIPLAKKGVLQLKTIPDLPGPIVKEPLTKTSVAKEAVAIASRASAQTKTTSREALIACIDDNPVVFTTLKKILMPAGYRMLKIIDPMRGIAQLAERKPDLIFLDLIMPNTSGYNVCNFLRNTPVFAKTPIIILTSSDSKIDRTRAQLVGATDFLTKPPDPAKTLQLVEKYLESVPKGDRTPQEKELTGEMPRFFSSPSSESSTIRNGL